MEIKFQESTISDLQAARKDLKNDQNGNKYLNQTISSTSQSHNKNWKWDGGTIKVLIFSK